MNVSLYQAAAALNANARWQEVLSENLAATSVPGHKKQEVSFGTMVTGMMQEARGSGHVMTLPITSVSTNFSQGELRYTGDPTDMSLEGPGFFAIDLPGGQEGYTRDGEFRIDPFGQLITKQGYPVMGNGGPINIDLNNSAPLSISPRGDVSQGIDQLGRLEIVEFGDPKLLTQVQGGYYVANLPSINSAAAEATTVRQEFLENSNASSFSEMSQLIVALRAFETNQRVIQVQDERMGRLISELGTPT